MLAKKRKNIKNNIVKIKSSRQLERHLKGVSNYRRIEILFLIADNKGITVDSIAVKLKCNVKTISGHLFRLAQAGLIRKSNRSNSVIHELSPYGRIFHKFLNSFRNYK
jgi:DNA-binding MarR family transcriptional regulator